MATASFNALAPTSSPFVNVLVSEYYFTGTITYFLDGANWANDNATAAFQGAIGAWASVANVTFSQQATATNADWVETLYSDAASTTLGSHYFPNNSGLGGEFNIDHPLFTAANNIAGGVSYITFIHELGHGLGLNHPFEAGNTFPGVTADDPYDAGDFNHNNGFYTVMSYADDPWFAASPSYAYGYAKTPMAFDIAAVQARYGANMTTATGNTVYTLPTANVAGTGWVAIWDAGGVDTISGETNSGGVTIDLRAATLLNEAGGGGRASWQSGTAGGSTIYGGFSIANNVVIENAIGSGFNDTITGNSAANVILGLAGVDTINAGDGSDTITGGAGADVLTGGAGIDLFKYLTVTDAPNTGTTETITDFTPGTDKIDLIGLNVTSHTIANVGGVYTLTAVTGAGTVKIAVTTTTGALTASDIFFVAVAGPINGTGVADTLTGTSGNDEINGLGGADTILGLAGDDIINGGTGIDTMEGGLGNDSYFVDVSGDIIVERTGQGTDQVYSSASTYQLKSTVENIALIAGGGDAFGNANANVMEGNSGNNRLTGNGGADQIYGFGGNDRLIGGATGNDQLYGGAGNDTYDIDDAFDLVTEQADEGTDHVIASTSYSLNANVEQLTLIGTAQSGFGNDINNLIKGNASANILEGRGGNDVIYAGNGNDTINGGAGQDQLYGQTGADIFAFDDGDFGGVTAATADRIADFNLTQGDTISLSLVDAITGGADDAFTFIGSAAFSNVAGQLRAVNSTTHTTIMGDQNGDGVADFWIRMNGVIALDATDFVL